VGLQHDRVLRSVRPSPSHRLHRVRLHLPPTQRPSAKPARLKQQVTTGARGPLFTSPLAPRGELCPQGEMFTALFTPRVNTLDCLEE
jgi:hypothetical protein